MSKFGVCGPPTLLTAMVAALVRERYGQASVDIVPRKAGPDDGVRVSHGPYWFYVSPSRTGDPGAVRALSEGATTVLHVGSTPDELDHALNAIVTGERGFVPVDFVRWMAGEALGKRAPASEQPRVSLTQREREILQLVARGYTNQEIADTLSISANTVRSHLHTLSVKLDATSRTKMLANARALAIPEALEFGHAPGLAGERASA